MKIADIFSISKGQKAPDFSDKKFEGSSRFIQIDDLRSDDNLKYCKANPKLVHCKPADVIIAWDGANAGTIGYGLEGIIGSTLAKLVPKTDKVFSPYVGYFLKSKFTYLRENCTGATIPHISKKSLEVLDLPLPPLAEQRHIAQVLDQADRLRQQDRQLLAHYDQLVQAVFMDMFGDPVRNEKGWESAPLVELIASGDRINYGVIQPGLEYDNGVPVVRVGDIRNMQVNTENLKRIDPLIEADYKRSRLVGDEILLGCVGTIGAIAIADDRLIGYNIVRATARIRCNTELLNRIYLAYFMATPFVQSYFADCTRAVGNPTLNIKQIAETDILLPPIELQNQFAEAVVKIEVQKKSIQQLQAHSEALFNSLLQQAFRGELTRPEAAAGPAAGQLALALG